MNEDWLQLAGDWTGHYEGHGDEVIRIEQDGPLLRAVKVTGDTNVPAGELTWRADLRTLAGEGQIAERRFRNPKFVNGRLVIESPERIQFVWENVGPVTYRRGAAIPAATGWAGLLKRMFSDSDS